VNDAAEAAAAFTRLRRLLHGRDVRTERDPAHEHVLVESFIPGVEYAVEGVMRDGVLQVLAIIDKPDPLDGPFFEETIYRMPSMAPAATQARIAEAVADACAALGLHHGPVHAECRVDGTTVYVLEVAARPIGGLCARALRMTSRNRDGVAGESGPVSFEQVLLRHALGEDISHVEREATASGVMMIPIPRRGVYRRVEGVAEAKAVDGIEDVRITAKPDVMLVPLPEGKSYLGFIFARAHDAAAVDRALRDAHGRLHFVVDRELAVL
jgi:hypothetical protein